ncbi:hypothetical protein M3484_19680 [Pseudomonas sp. GX19020]|uniref:hypothetical protein n=1 Tax=Pseudomonas sp. GX19020 TaxID=2942277 RepID=UPI0020192F18|nr:hypothetical protein [Pseudomonas sp. GX19020]MCL4068788.1 hypothetical protein [Pseudomonas sp. GX19020]
MGKRLIIPGITSFTGPKIYADPILSKGSLLLWDPTHLSGGDAAGVANGASLANVAADIAARLIGISEAAARPTISNVGAEAGSATVTQSMKRRTAKGGLYGVYSKAHAVGDRLGQTNFGMLADFAKEYMWTNDHMYFMSIWARSLRSGRVGTGSAASPLSAMHGSVSGSANQLLINNGTIAAPSRQQGFSTNNALFDANAPRINNLARQGWAGTKPTLVNAVGPWFMTGSYGSWAGSLNQPGWSGIIERCYIEDLTVSGRSYAEVDAIDFAIFTAAHAAGGAWFGDTYPDPATLP